MVHNGIEYGIMQLLAETYDLMKRGLEMNDDEISEVYALWNKGELNGYLMEITSQIFSKQDKKTSKRLIDEILDVAKQKGTGMWTSQSAMELQVPIPTIDLAVAMRDLSVFEKERKQASMIYQRPIKRLNSDRSTFLKQLHSALYAAMIITYAQGLALLAVASDKYKYQIDFESVPLIWRGGCIIRAALLEDICAAFRTKTRSAEFAAGSQYIPQNDGASGELAPGRMPGGRNRSASSWVNGFFGLFRCLSQRMASSQSHSSPARLFWSPHL